MKAFYAIVFCYLHQNLEVDTVRDIFLKIEWLESKVFIVFIKSSSDRRWNCHKTWLTIEL